MAQTTMPPQEIFKALCEIFQKCLENFDGDRFIPQTSLKDDLGIDSIDIVEIQMEVEKKFNIPEDIISDKTLEGFKTVEDIMNFIIFYDSNPAELTCADILKILPHGPRWIFVDAVNCICLDDGNQSIRGIHNVSASAWWAPEHMPGNPLMPGVLMLEGLNQTAGILLYFLSNQQKQPVVFTGFDKGLIRRQAQPGSKIEYFISLEKNKRGIFVFNGQVYVDGCESIKTKIKLAQA